MRNILLLAVLGSVACQSEDVIRIDRRAAGRPFPHFWEQMFGSGRANVSLREGYRIDLRAVRQITDVQYIRFHAIFHDENGVFNLDQSGKPWYNWSYVDQIYDGLLSNGVKPFIELSFMPRQMASRDATHPFWYKQNVAPPKDWAQWGKLVEDFTRHLLERYGEAEVATWYFEVWNEPNIDFWAGEPKFDTYTRLYAEAAKGVKRANSKLRVGGPSTAQAAWVDRFIEWCVSNNVPLDFVSTHAYGNDSTQDLFGTSEKITRRDMLARAVKKVHDQVKQSQRPNLPVIWSEFNATYMNQPEVTDSPFMGPWLASTIRASDGLADMMSYWSFSDVFEEQGVVRTPFYGGYGLITVGNIPKAAFNDFRLLHLLGEERLPESSDSAIVTRRKNGSIAVVLWNYAEPGENVAPRTFRLEFTGGSPKLRMSMVDAQHGSSLTAWRAMGSPAFPSRKQQEELRNAAKLPPPAPFSGSTITLAPQALALIETEP